MAGQKWTIADKLRGRHSALIKQSLGCLSMVCIQRSFLTKARILWMTCAVADNALRDTAVLTSVQTCDTSTRELDLLSM